jgi:hypothetical protein
MEKARKGMGVSIILLVLALSSIGAGTYFNSQSWAKEVDVISYNQGVLAYKLPKTILPAAEDRPQEDSAVRAEALFQQAALKSTGSKLKSLAMYNWGTLAAGEALTSITGTSALIISTEGRTKLEEGISKLSEAIRINPDNENAKYNLELLEKIQNNLVTEKGMMPSVLRSDDNTPSRPIVHKGF